MSISVSPWIVKFALSFKPADLETAATKLETAEAGHEAARKHAQAAGNEAVKSRTVACWTVNDSVSSSSATALLRRRKPIGPFLYSGRTMNPMSQYAGRSVPPARRRTGIVVR